jgi:hypothetical protein
MTTFPFTESPRYTLSIRFRFDSGVPCAGGAPRVLVTLKKGLYRDCSFVENTANESASELRIEVRSGEGIEPCGGGWFSLMQLVVEIILTQRTQPKSIDVLHERGKLVFKTNGRVKLYREGTFYNTKLPTPGTCMETKGGEKTAGDENVLGGGNLLDARRKAHRMAALSAETRSNQSHEANHPLSHHHLRRPTPAWTFESRSLDSRRKSSTE